MKHLRFILNFLLVISFLSFFNSQLSFPAEEAQKENPEIAGEFFGVPVPMSNYYFAKRMVLSYGANWRGTPKDKDELEDLVWQELLFSYESFRRGIKASDEEIDAEIEKLLKANKVKFKWRVDKKEYQKWVQDNLGVPLDVFRNQIEHLVKLEKLRQQVLDSIKPEITEEEAYQKFLNEYNTLMVELKQFDNKKDAEKFYQQAIKPVTKKDTENLIWQDLITSFEADKRNIKATDKEIDAAVTKLLRSLEARFNWQKDEESYKKWVDEEFKMDIEQFRKKIALFASVDKLLQKIAGKEEKQIDFSGYDELIKKNKSIARAYPKFIEQYVKDNKNMVKFKNLKEAKKFCKKIKREAGFWEDEKRKDTKSFKVPGFVALDFLINLWGFKQEDAEKMLKAKIGGFYPPAPIYKGYGVFKILKVRPADTSKYGERKQYYYDKVTSIKKYEGWKKWVEDFKKEANIKVFIK